MNIVRFQGENPNIYYEFDKDSPVLGEGGMGRVYPGFRIDAGHNFQSLVAIKCIKPELVSNPTIIQRAQREASIRVDHDNLIRMYGFFSGAEYNQYSGTYTPSYFIAMERLMGVNLDEIFFQGILSDRTGVVVPIAEELRNAYMQDRVAASLEVMRSVLSGVGYLHSLGYIHRDLDPSNVMFTQSGATKIIDFGICKRIGMNSREGYVLTQSGQFIGKVAYAAPELILGDLLNQGPQTDIYALGIMLFQMVTGHLPVSGTDQEVMDAHLKGKLNFSEISDKKLRKVLARATAKEISKRYYSAHEFMMALDSCYDKPHIQSSLASAVPPVSVSSARDCKPATPFDIPTFIIPICAVLGLISGIIISLIIF